MSWWTETLMLWLADFFVAATLLLLLAVAITYCIGQPARRLAVAWATMVGLTALAVLWTLPGWPRMSCNVLSEDVSTASATAGEVDRELAGADLLGDPAVTTFPGHADPSEPSTAVASPVPAAPSVAIELGP